MSTWRLGVGLVAVLVGTNAARAQSCNLTEADIKDSNFRVEVRMELTGEITVRQNGKDLVLKQSAQARHNYIEHLMERGPTGLADKAARIYEVAESTLVVADDKSSRKLHADRSFMMVQRHNDQIVAYCPKGEVPLNVEEFELTEHFDTLALPGLLPNKEIAVGESWKLSNGAAQALCDVDGLTQHDLTGKLDKVAGGIAWLHVSGTAQGIDLGAAVTMTIQATAQFDIKERRVIALEWTQKDEREQGPVSPALKATVTTNLKRTPTEQPKELHPYVLVPFDAKTPPQEKTVIGYADPKSRFALSFARDWHLVGRTDDYLILRLLERGDFLAQATIAPWHKATPGKHLTLEQFQAVAERVSGWEPGKILEKVEVKSERTGYTILRIAASGQHEGVEALQFSYLVAGPEGQQTLITFTMTPPQAAKLEGRDLTLVRSLVFPSLTEAAPPAAPPQ